MPHILESDISSTASVPSVDPDEIAFAMALFLGAASGKFRAPQNGSSGFPLGEGRFQPLGEPLEDRTSESLPLSRAISVLWHHYQGDERQRAIWSRVVAFHAMERGNRLSLANETAASLDPAVIHAIAVAPLIEFGQFSELTFRETVERFSNRFSRPSAPTLHTVPRFPLVERLWRPVESLSGKKAWESLLSRALAVSSPEFPWLGSVQLKPGGFLEGFGASGQLPNSTQAAESELAVVRSLIGLLRTIVGHGVTMRLMESVCPEVPSETWGSGIRVSARPGVESNTSPA